MSALVSIFQELLNTSEVPDLPSELLVMHVLLAVVCWTSMLVRETSGDLVSSESRRSTP